MNIRLTPLTVMIRATLTALLVAALPLMIGPFNPTAIPTANAAGVTVSNTRVTATTDNTASLAWDTSINSCAQINYGTTPGALNRQDFENGCPKSTGHTHTITGLASNTLYYYQIVAIGNPSSLNGVSPQLSFTTSGGAPLSISNINVVNIGPTNATITWSTNKVASGKLKYGLTTSYELPEVIQGTADSTSHSIPLFGLAQGTTYHFRVESTAGSETDASTTDRTFVTTSGSGTGSLPYLTTPPRVNAVNNQAVVTFSTNVPTAALIEYEQTPNTTLSAQACDATTNCAAPAPQPNSLSLNHTVTLTGLTVPSAEYSYKITIIDAGSNISSTSEFTFNTSASGTDHVFSTGGCNDGTPIGQCNAAGQFCRPGGGDPVYDCRPTTPCSSQCTTGSTCQPNGDCTVDPNLTGSPAQCNQKICYQHCNANSGNKSGLSCTNDGECVDAAAGLSGKCTVGSFNNPTVPGCYASWPSCDANIILKVRPDRVCDKWMTCKTSLPITDTTGKTENQCFDLTICNSLSPNGQCNGVLEGGQCSNDPLRFCQTDADCNGGGRCLTTDNGGPVSVTYSTPADVGQISNLTGYTRAGLDWTNQPSSPRIEGNYPYSLAQQIGTRVKIENSDFEDITFVGSCKNKRSQACNADEECKNGSNDACQFQADSTVPLQQVWEGLTPAGSTGTASVVAETEGATNSRNVFMKVTPTDRPDSGARTINEARFTTQTNQQYVLSVRLRSAQSDQPIKVTLSNDSNVVKVLDDENPDGVVKLSTSWKTYRLGPVDGPGGRTRLNILTTVTGDPAAYYVDDVALLPALKVNDATLITQNCRIFPGDDSPKCDYVDGNGVTQTGFKGFCLERDPLNSSVCISWWPVDILAGENIFAQDTNTGYQGRRPLYACAEAIQENVPTTASQGFGSSPDDGVFITGNNAPDAIYRDCGAFGNHSCAATATHNISGMNIELQDVQFVRLNFDPDEGNDWGAVFNYDYLDDGAIGLGNGASYYYIDVYPNPSTDADFGNSPYFGTGKLIEQDDGGTDKGQWPRSWKAWVEESAFKASGGGKKNGVGIRVWSDGILPTSKLTAISVAAFDDSTDDFSPDWNVWIMKRPYCKKLAQLAGGQDSAWVDRTGPTSTYVVPDLNLRNESDLEPFGMVANPGTPLVSNWPKLFTEGRNLDFPAPTYQVRGGIAYACAPALSGNGFRDTSVPIQSLPGLCGVKRCAYAGRVVDGNSTAKPCFDNSDCKVGTELGVCIGSGQCLKYNEARHEFDAAGSSKAGCTTNAGCTVAGETCVGGVASYKGNQTFGPTNPPIDTTDPAPTFAQYRLQRLFAQAFSIWEWQDATREYTDVTGTRADVQRWLPPTDLCQVCSGTNAATNGKACTSDASCGSGSTCVSGDRHPRENANPATDSTADYCAIKPQVLNVNIDNPEVTIGDGGLFLLKFNTKVDREQVPITRITIDWGDGSPDTIDSGLRIAPKEGTDVPHLYAHTFDCRSVRCEYFPKIQIEDNWGWCSDGSRAGLTPCNDNPNSTTNPWVGGVKVIVE